MSYVKSLSVHVRLIEYGDALIYGYSADSSEISGLTIKQLLFANHEPSFYGTDLEIEEVDGLQITILPAEQVLPFFAEPNLLLHVGWVWEEEAQTLLTLSPLLLSAIRERKFVPSFTAYQAGKLGWVWDEEAIQQLPAWNLEIQEILEHLSPSLKEGIESAFSAAIFHSYYGTQAAAADLRREYPRLFLKEHSAFTGMDASSWLIAVGWKADLAPFRPVLQLLEPDDSDESGWRLQLLLQDKLEEAQLIPIELARDGTASGEWPEGWTAYVNERSASWLERLSRCLPQERLIGSERDVLAEPLSNEAAWQFLTAESEQLLEAGWPVLLPAWWQAASRKKPRLRAKVRADSGASEQGRTSLFGLDSIVDFDWRIAIGDTDLTEEEFSALSERGERLVRFRGQWIPLDPALLQGIRRAMESIDRSEGLSFQDVLQLHLLEQEDQQGESSPGAGQPPLPRIEVELNQHLQGLVRQLEKQEWDELPPIPDGLQASLRPYQHHGYAWLTLLRRFGLGACLADDMGLGKTVQLITYLLKVKEQQSSLPEESRRPSLIICPTSVLGNWQRELSKFAPSLSTLLHYGSRRNGEAIFSEEAMNADVVLTSYATATLDQELLQGLTWSSVCLDEAQNIKNADTKQSAAVRSFKARHRIALTGTPIENRLSELWSIYDFILPGYLGTARGFQKRFGSLVEKDQDEQQTSNLRRLVRPFMLRRKKKDPAIMLDLPDKNEMKVYMHLTAEQGALYDQIVQKLMQRMEKLEGIQRKGAILSALTQLKQLCDHPALITKEALPSSLPIADEPESVNTLITRSSKLERLVEMVKELREEQEKCLIFTQYIGIGEMLQMILEHELMEPVLYLNGSTSKTARDKMIDSFQTGQPFNASSDSAAEAKSPGVFILSLKAGGVGLNLTAANHVFHFDRWWNPAVENQATDRAYRMGQTRDVQVHKFICLGTLEERIDEMLESKQQLSDQVISSSENWITELSTEALRDLFTLRREWAD